MYSIFRKLLPWALVLVLISCGTTALLITVKRPAEINLKDYKNIAIGDILDPNGKVSKHSQDIADGIATTLFSSGYFEVLDRQHLNQIISEHNLNSTGAIDEETAAKFGSLVGTAVLVFGRIQTDKYDEQITKNDPFTDKKGGHHQYIFRKGVYTVTVNVKLTDIQTGRIIATKTLTAGYKDETSNDNQMPADINKDDLYSSCVKNILQQFMQLVAPYNVQVTATFETDKMLPEVDQAIKQFTIGEWDEGINLLKTATEKTSLEPKIQAKAQYDLGLAKMYGGDPGSAVDNFKKAMSLNPSSSTYTDAVVQAKAEKGKLEKLNEQEKK